MAFLGNDFTTGPKTRLEMTEADIDKLIDEQVTFELEPALPTPTYQPVQVSMSIQTDPIRHIEGVKEGKDMGMQTVDTEVDLIWHHIRDPKLCESLKPPRPSIKFTGKQLVGTCTNCGSLEDIRNEAKMDKDKSRSLQKINNIQQKEIDRLTLELINMKHKYVHEECICSGSSCTKLLYKEQEGYKAHFHHGGFVETLRYCKDCSPERKLNKFYNTPDRRKTYRHEVIMENYITGEKTLLRELKFCIEDPSDSESDEEIDVEDFLGPSELGKRSRDEEDEPVTTGKKPKIVKGKPFKCPWCGTTKQTKRLLLDHLMSSEHVTHELKNKSTNFTVKINIKNQDTIFDYLEKGTSGDVALKAFGINPDNVYSHMKWQCKCGHFKSSKSDKFYNHIRTKHMKNKSGIKKTDMLTCKHNSNTWLRQNIDEVPWENYDPAHFVPVQLPSGSYAM